MRAIIYLRVSTDDQAERGAGLAAQADACASAAARAGWDLGPTHSDDGISGAAPLDRRPALMAAIQAAGPGDVILVAKRDRLGRDLIGVAMIEAAIKRRGARVVSAAGEGTDGDDPSSVLMRNLIDSFAAYERHVIKARTKAALDAKRRRGERVGTIPYGRQLAADGRTLVDSPGDREILAAARGWRAQGWSLREIAAELTRRGVPTKQGRAGWRHSTIHDLLKGIPDAPIAEEASPGPR